MHFAWAAVTAAFHRLLAFLYLISFFNQFADSMTLPEYVEDGELEDLPESIYNPQFHLTPPRNWLNDPCAPIFYQGKYHIYYQHAPFNLTWHPPLTWMHAQSKDLISWERSWTRDDYAGAAVFPTESYDKESIFSGSGAFLIDSKDSATRTFVDSFKSTAHPVPGSVEQIPVLAYTGITQLPIHYSLPYTHGQENQNLLVALDPTNLSNLTKFSGNPILRSPPPEWNVTGWRDPYLFKCPEMDGFLNDGEHFYLILGSGFRDVSGAVLLYYSKDLAQWDSMPLPFYLSPVIKPNTPDSESSPEYSFNIEMVNFISLNVKDPATDKQLYVMMMGPEGPLAEPVKHRAAWAIGYLDWVPVSSWKRPKQIPPLDSKLSSYAAFRVISSGFMDAPRGLFYALNRLNVLTTGTPEDFRQVYFGWVKESPEVFHPSAKHEIHHHVNQSGRLLKNGAIGAPREMRMEWRQNKPGNWIPHLASCLVPEIANLVRSAANQKFSLSSGKMQTYAAINVLSNNTTPISSIDLQLKIELTPMSKKEQRQSKMIWALVMDHSQTRSEADLTSFANDLISGSKTFGESKPAQCTIIAFHQDRKLYIFSEKDSEPRYVGTFPEWHFSNTSMRGQNAAHNGTESMDIRVLVDHSLVQINLDSRFILTHRIYPQIWRSNESLGSASPFVFLSNTNHVKKWDLEGWADLPTTVTDRNKPPSRKSSASIISVAQNSDTDVSDDETKRSESKTGPWWPYMVLPIAAVFVGAAYILKRLPSSGYSVLPK